MFEFEAGEILNFLTRRFNGGIVFIASIIILFFTANLTGRNLSIDPKYTPHATIRVENVHKCLKKIGIQWPLRNPGAFDFCIYAT